RAWIWPDKARFLTQQAAPQRLTLKIQESELRLELNEATSRRDASERVNSVIKRLPDESKEEVIERLSLALRVAMTQRPPEEFSPVAGHQAREMDANGVELRADVLTRASLSNVGDERLREELCGSKSRLEGVLGHQVYRFCYPNGDNDGRVQCEVARAGY